MVLTGLAATAGSALAAPPDPQQQTTTVTQTGETAYQIPLGTTSLQVTLIGGQGAGPQFSGCAGGQGGSGAKVTATLAPPAALSTLYVEVGGSGCSGQTNAGGGGAGGSGSVPNPGGGASDIQTCSVSASGCTDTANPATDPRLLVAGGGGGGGQNNGYTTTLGATGGSAGASDSLTGPGAGGAGSATSEGAPGNGAGLSNSASSAPSGASPCASATATGTVGTPGQGGAGGNDPNSTYTGGGGGGGGWLGGSGGGSGGCAGVNSAPPNGSGGGGGAGASFVEAGASGVSVSEAGSGAGAQAPEVVITAIIDTQTTTIASAGQTAYTVPPNALALEVTAIGAPGASSGCQNAATASGGHGADVEATFTPPAGHSTLYAEVGGPGPTGVAPNACSTSAPGGGGRSDYAGAGGGASDLQTCSVLTPGCTDTADPASDPRLIVAAGGGGGGQDSVSNGVPGGGGAGGNAGASTVYPSDPGPGGTGTSSGNAIAGYDSGLASSTAPTTLDQAGAGGSTGCQDGTGNGAVGSASGGGAGGDADSGDSLNGGGGGGGWFGGAGGGAGLCGFQNGASDGGGGGGGAGVSYVENGSSGVSVNEASASPEIVIVAVLGQRPAFTSAAGTTFTVGKAGSFTVTTTGRPVAKLTESGSLPSGVSFHDNGNGTATLSGTPAPGSAGTYPLTLTAANGTSANTTQNFTLTVAQTPSPSPKLAPAHLRITRVSARALRKGCQVKLNARRVVRDRGRARLRASACRRAQITLTGTIAAAANGQQVTVTFTAKIAGRRVTVKAHGKVKKGHFTITARLPGRDTTGFANRRKDTRGDRWSDTASYPGNRTLNPATTTGHFTLEVEPRR